MNFFRRLFGKQKRATQSVTQGTDVTNKALNTVIFDSAGITHSIADGQSEFVTWADLKTITVVTTNQGPFVDDVFWVLAGDLSRCVVPSESQGMQELLPRLQTLPGFDNRALISSMSSTQNAQFLCWSRDVGE